MKKPIVILESPWSGGPQWAEHYLRRCIRDSIKRGEAPFASHRMYTAALDDLDPEERALGMGLVLPYLEVADKVVVYEDYDVSAGMAWGIRNAEKAGKEIVRRKIGRNS